MSNFELLWLKLYVRDRVTDSRVAWWTARDDSVVPFPREEASP